MFEKQFADYFNEQKSMANGRRLEMLKKDLTGEIRLLKDVVFPVLGTFNGLTMEYEMVSSSGIRIFGDLFFKPIESIIETEGFVSHAELITRDRFDFEKMRIRTFAEYGYPFIPFSWDDIVKRPEVCRRSLYVILGKYGSTGNQTEYHLTVYEREIIRYALRLNRPFGLEDVCFCLQLGRTTCIQLLKILLEKGLIRPVKEGKLRVHAYELGDKARLLIM
ncbi:hypothetical protein [Cohnella silvisoli]|uniref:Transcriptional regulator n=1 Tax=Cohnella silvisoli TaxID=2873699 RepID=A0ABV1KPD0_9BACL|nr:hypothetical protein [Cohnella silvisoli]MCD9022371.1 hypothetical protein [Cohnella silvisoli]